MNRSEQVWKSLEDEEYRREFNLDVDTGLAFQIRMLREKNEWTQEQLGERAGGKKQETISQWENPNYGGYSLKTLKSLAVAFDVGLMVRFAPFSDLVEWNTNLTPERLAPPSFNEEDQARGRTIGRVITYTAATGIYELSATIASSQDLGSSLQLEGTINESMTVQPPPSRQASAGQTAPPASAAGEEKSGALAA